MNKTLPVFRSKVVVALGANQPFGQVSLTETLALAVVAVGQRCGAIRAVSNFFATPCFPAGAGPDYVNSAICVQTNLSPSQFLGELHKIEAKFGRARKQRWGIRTLDLDIIAFDDLILPDAETHNHWRNLPADQQVRRTPDQMIIPHPRLQDRAFVLVPLGEIVPNWVHPITGRTVLQMRDNLAPDLIDEVVRL